MLMAVRPTVLGLLVATMVFGCAGLEKSRPAATAQESPPTAAHIAKDVQAAPEGGAYETPPVLSAAQILPDSLRRGAEFSVEDRVLNDGLLNIYTLKSRFGVQRVVSTALLRTRIHEINAMNAMRAVDTGEAFGKNVVQGGKNVLRGAEGLITDPGHTLESAASGVGKLFERAGEGMFGAKKSKYEESAAAKLSGYAGIKREIAKKYGVDPYSSNTALQTELERLAGPAYAGTLTATLAKAVIPGGVGLVVSGVGTVTWLGDIDVATPPAELRLQSRNTLKSMGIAQTAADRFLDNDEYTPTQQAALVRSLAAMPARPVGRDAFIALATRTTNQDEALFRTRMAAMYAGFSRDQARIERFVPLGRLVGARTVDGRLVLCFPLDHLVLTLNVAGFIEDMRLAPGKGKKEIWLGGTASPAVKAGLAKAGFGLRENAAALLLGEKR